MSSAKKTKKVNFYKVVMRQGKKIAFVSVNNNWVQTVYTPDLEKIPTTLIIDQEQVPTIKIW